MLVPLNFQFFLGVFLYIKILHISEDIYSYSCIDDEYGYAKKVITFGISANGDYICFDYRKCNENPCIILMYHDDFYEDENGDTKMVTSHIADSFDAFLDMLYELSD